MHAALRPVLVGALIALSAAGSAADERIHTVTLKAADGTMLALDPATGKDRWATEIRGPGYASPIEVTLGAVPQIVTMTTRSVIGVESASGKLLWEFPFDDEWNENIVTPVPMSDGVIVSGVRQGTRRLTITRTGGAWTAKQSWHTPDVAMYMSSPVMVNGTLYGHSSKRKGQFVAMDPETGKLLWGTEGRNATSAAVLAAGNHLAFLTTESQLIVSAIDAAAFQELRRYTVASSSTYARRCSWSPTCGASTPPDSTCTTCTFGHAARTRAPYAASSRPPRSPSAATRARAPWTPPGSCRSRASPWAPRTASSRR